MLECEICGEMCDVKIMEGGIFCSHCEDETIINLELEDKNNTHMEDYQGTIPVDMQEKIMKGEYL